VQLQDNFPPCQGGDRAHRWHRISQPLSGKRIFVDCRRPRKLPMRMWSKRVLVCNVRHRSWDLCCPEVLALDADADLLGP